MMQTFDIVSKNTSPKCKSIQRGYSFGNVLIIRTKLVMIQQNYYLIDGVNYRAYTKRFTHKQLQKLTSCQFLEDAKRK